MKKVFISYVNENIEIVKKLYQELKAPGLKSTGMNCSGSIGKLNRLFNKIACIQRNITSAIGPT